MSDHWFNPNIDVRKSGEWGIWTNRKGSSVGVGEGITIADSKAISLNEL
nr:hypothetical protein [Mycoplasmoides genitalium]